MSLGRHLVRSMELHQELDIDERIAIEALSVDIRWYPKHTRIIREGDRLSESLVIIDGFACRYKILPGGQRQILSYHIPGDIPNLDSLHSNFIDYNVGALSPTKVALIPNCELSRLAKEFPRLSDALWRHSLLETAIFRVWLAGIGRRLAHQRVAHLICEVYLRMKSIGAAQNAHLTFPVTQAELADTLGLSPVHVNRVLKELRRDGLIIQSGKQIQIPHWAELQRVAEFDPKYLNLDSDGRSLSNPGGKSVA